MAAAYESDRSDSPSSRSESSVKDMKIPFDRPVSYASVMVRRYDQMYLLDGDDDFKRIFVDGMRAHVGVQRTKQYGDITYVKVKGNPFAHSQIGSTTAESIRFKVAMARILRDLLDVGWIWVTSAGLSRMTGQSSLFFRRGVPPHAMPFSIMPTPKLPILALSLSSTDKLQLVNTPEPIVHTLMQTIKEHYPEGIQDITAEGEDNHVIKLNGNPWFYSGETKTHGKLLVAALMARLEQAGFAFYGAADLKGTTDALYFLPTQNPYPASFASYVMFSLDDLDDLRVYNADPSLIGAISDAIVYVWPPGIQHQGEHRDGHEWKLKGSPWWSRGSDAVAARRVILSVFDTMSRYGYRPYAALDLSRAPRDKSLIMFRQYPQELDYAPVRHAAVSPSSEDKLRFICFDDGLRELDMIRAVEDSYPKGIKRHAANHGTFEIKMHGSPFLQMYSWKTECHGRMAMSSILGMLEDHGWTVVSCPDVSAKAGGSNEHAHSISLHIWIFSKPFKAVADAPPSYAEAIG